MADAVVYTWEDPGGSVRIQLELDVVERLSQAIEQGLGTGGRGIEIGGILLGRSIPGGGRVVRVDDFDLVPFQHWRGPSYTASPKDRDALAARLARRSPDQVVGYFRSHTRPGLYLDQDDFNIVRSYFPDPLHVFLVVRPSMDGPATAGFFIWEDGDINRKAPYRQFPFDRGRLLNSSSPLAVVHPEPVASRRVPVVRQPRIPATAPPRTAGLPRFRIPLPQLPWLVVPLLAGLFLVAGLFVSQDRAQKQVPSSPVAVPGGNASGLPLEIANTGKALQVRWDPNAPVIRNADLGVLRITDGDRQLRRELEPVELASGSVTYTPESGKVNFELRVYNLTEKLDKSLERRVPSAPSAPATQVAEIPSATGQSNPPAVSAPEPPPAARTVTADRVISKASPKLAPKRLHMVPLPSPRSAAVLPLQAREIESPPPIAGNFDPRHSGLAPILTPGSMSIPSPYTVISYEPPRHGPLRRMFSKLSSLGDADEDGFVPPSPVRRVTPHVSGVKGSVDVKVYIDESGKVSRAQLLTKSSELSEPSLNAAREWHFTPARKHDKPVPSELVLHFRYRGGEM